MKIHKTHLRCVMPQRAKSPMIGISTLNFPVETPILAYRLRWSDVRSDQTISNTPQQNSYLTNKTPVTGANFEF